MRYKTSELDIFYLSYDEPNASANFRDLVAKSPRPVKRVHGIKGFDAAHRACALESETRRFITVDGDNLVEREFFEQVVDDELGRDLVFSFKACNVVNGLIYGNGGIKVWPRGLVTQVPTHESDPDGDSTDFCWTYRYMQVDRLCSHIHCNGSPLQAFRSGYREAVKMTLIDGKRLANWQETLAQFHRPNLSRLRVWTSVGRDVENGAWAIYGTRQGLVDMWVTARPDIHDIITDYDVFNAYFAAFADRDPVREGIALGGVLASELGLDTADLDARQSRWFKDTYINPPRSGLMRPAAPPVEFFDE